MKLKQSVIQEIPLQSIPYSIPNVTVYFLLTLFLIVFPAIWLWIRMSELKQIVFPLMLLTISGYFTFRIIKAFFHMLIKRPMIELSAEEYIDNLNGIRIKWCDVKYLQFIEGKAPFVQFTLKETTTFYKRLNGYKRLFYKFENSNTNSFQTNIRFAKGNNTDIFDQIQKAFISYK